MLKRFALIFVGALFAFPVFAQDALFVGYSTSDVLGDVRIHGMHNTCQADFGRRSRMCTSQEYFLSPGATIPGFLGAWVHPVTGGGNIDFSRRQNPPACVNGGAWERSAGELGMIISNSGAMDVDSCGIARPVTCCKIRRH